MNADRKAGGGLVQRCVIIHRDENGYGLTVSGDNPVYVQSVRPHGAADKSGVQVGDQIRKVNGMIVTQSNHIEVVRLIKSGSFVALTLLGKDNSSKSPAAKKSSPRVTHTRSKSLGNNLNLHSLPATSQPLASDFQNDKVLEIERNLNQEREFHHRVLAEYMRVPSQKSQQELADSQTRINALEHQLNILTGSVPSQKSGSGFTSNSRQPFRPVESQANWTRSTVTSRTKSLTFKSSGSSSSLHTGTNNFHPREGLENQSIQEQSPNLKVATRLTSSASSPNIDSSMLNAKRTKSDPLESTDGPHPLKMMDKKLSADSRQVPDSSFDALFKQAKYDNLAIGMPIHSAASVISMEDDEFDLEAENFENHGPFINLIELKDKPAHLAVFLHFLFSNGDPSALFFWLVTGTYEQEQGTVKDFRKWAYEIYSTFVANQAPLKVEIGVGEELAIEQSLEDPKAPEERLRSLFNVARSLVFTEVNEHLTDFRTRRAIGLGGLFGDHQLENELDRQKELKVIEQTLVPHLDSLLADIDSPNETRNDRNSAMSSALITFMRQVGLGNKILARGGNALDRVKSFAEKEKNSFFNKSKKGKIQIHGHQFQAMQYTHSTFCGICDRLLWGIGPQGYQCAACEYNVHQRNCIDSINETCPGKLNTSKLKKPGMMKPPEYPEATESGRMRVPSIIEPENKKNEMTDDNEHDPERSATPTDERKSATAKNQKKISDVRTKKSPATLPDRLNPGKPVNGAVSDPPTPDIYDDDTSDSDLDVEPEVPAWQTTVPKDVIKNIKSKEVKRQEVIHELIHTERTHVRNLKVLNKLFYRPFMRETIIQSNYIKLIFPNLEELIDVHESLLIPFKKRAAEEEVIDSVGDIMLERFGGEAGDKMKNTCAIFCRGQKHALEQIKKLKATQRDFQTFMTTQEAHPLCNRLKFTDMIAKSHQRLVKYPLLLQRIANATSTNHKDHKLLEQSAQLSKDILNHVNDEIEEAENELRLEELASKVEDKRIIDKNDEEDDGNFDFTKHKLVYEGDLEWRLSTGKKDLHVVLLNDVLVFLQKQDDGNKYILKKYTVDNKIHKPLIKLSNIFIRDVAFDKKAFFLLSSVKSGPQMYMYELGAQSEKEQKMWVRLLSERVQKGKVGDAFTDRGRRGGLAMPAASSPSTPTKNQHQESDVESESEANGSQNNENEAVKEEQTAESTAPPLTKERLQELTDELTLKDEAIRNLYEEKNRIIAELRGKKYTDMISLESSVVGLEPNDAILAAIAQATRLTNCFNDVMTKTKDVVDEVDRANISESSASLHELLTSLMISIQSRDNQLQTMTASYNSARSTIDRMKGCTSPPPSTDTTDGLASPQLDQKQPTSPKLAHQPSVPVIREEEVTDISQAPKENDDIVPLKPSPFGFSKRPSDPSLERLTLHIDKNVSRSSSFSGPFRRSPDNT